jgi:hypothetical protein
MSANLYHAPTPDLRIVFSDSLRPHEEHDSQRALPLIERLKSEATIINPPVVAPIGSSQFVILDGANRCHAFQMLEYPHILVQVVTYESGLVELQTWNHVVCGWNENQFLEALRALDSIELVTGQHAQAIAHLITRSGQVIALRAPVDNAHERNAALRQIVRVYQQRAILHRTTLMEPQEIWPLFENGIALVLFPRFQPADIIAAAKYEAFLPPGVSRHIIQGRALRVNYPIERLKDNQTRLTDKNEELKRWLQTRLEKRQLRYYAEATYQFDE